MTRPESDTSASETPGDGPSADDETGADDGTSADDETSTNDDPDALFDVLVAEGVLAVGEDRAGTTGGESGRVRTTEEFDATRAVYHDSYVGISDDEFHEAVAATFGLPDAASAAELVATRDVSREEFVCYLAVDAHLDREVPPGDLAAMTGMVHEVVPDSPVPAALVDVTDDPGSFVAGRDRAAVTVWKRFCDPCESVKADLGTVLDAVPDDVPVAGIDGEVATDFCATHGVDAAPGFVLADGDDRRTVTGGDADSVATAIRSFFGG